MFLLSLVMPTYNRKNEICISLKTILSTLPKNIHNNDIELLVLDNASDYDIEQILHHVLQLAKNKLTVRIIRNDKNIGNDLNFLKGLCEAKGKYILQCSDRYYYKINFCELLYCLKEQSPDCIIWSDRFRKYTQTGITLVNSYKDEWLKDEFVVIDNNDVFFKIKKNDLLNSKYIQSGLINAFSDLVFLNRGSEYFRMKFSIFEKSHMLGVAAQIDAIDMAKSIHIFRIDFNSTIHQNIGGGNLYNRHNYNEVLYGNILLQERYPFIGTANDIKLLQVIGLMNLYLYDKAGFYFTFIKPDKSLINKIIIDNKLPLKWHQKLDLFFINHSFPVLLIKIYLFIKNIYLTIKADALRFKADSDIVDKIQKDFKNGHYKM